MKSTPLKRIAVLLAASALMVSCGVGGDDEAGSPTKFSLVPSSITVTGGVGACAANASGSVFVYGGVAPYRLSNTVPAYVSLDRAEVSHRGESFTVTFLGGCLNPGTIAVTDSLDNLVTLTLVNQKGS
jgi:hypothetical protein